MVNWPNRLRLEQVIINLLRNALRDAMKDVDRRETGPADRRGGRGHAGPCATAARGN